MQSIIECIYQNKVQTFYFRRQARRQNNGSPGSAKQEVPSLSTLELPNQFPSRHPLAPTMQTALPDTRSTTGSDRKRCPEDNVEEDQAVTEARQIFHATAMQRFRTRKLALDSENFGMTSKIATTIDFSTLSTRLKEKPLIKVMKLILHRICVLTAEGVRACPGAEDTKNVHVRVFLASYMIAHHPTKVFESIHAREADLQVASTAMLKVFDALVGAISSSNQGDRCEDAIKVALPFPGVLHTYLKAFEVWKLQDEAKLTDRIRHALIALYEAENHLDDEDSDTAKMRAEFQHQQDRLRTKMVQIAGEAALKAFDDSRGVSAAGGGSLKAAESSTEGGYSTMSSVTLSAQAATRGGGYSALPKRMSNQQLAHELLLDPSFTLDGHGGSRGENPVHAKIRNSFHVSLPK
jgi:hypothetical protein